MSKQRKGSSRRSKPTISDSRLTMHHFAIPQELRDATRMVAKALVATEVTEEEVRKELQGHTCRMVSQILGGLLPTSTGLERLAAVTALVKGTEIPARQIALVVEIANHLGQIRQKAHQEAADSLLSRFLKLYKWSRRAMEKHDEQLLDAFGQLDMESLPATPKKPKGRRLRSRKS